MNLRLCSAYSAAILACFGAWAPRAAAQITVFDTLFASTDTVSANVTFDWLAQSFTTHATAESISSVTVKMSSTGFDGHYYFQLLTDGGNYPYQRSVGPIFFGLNSSIFGGNTLSTSPTFFDLTFSGLSIPVLPNTRYWLLAKTDGSNVRWATHSGNLVPGEATASYFPQFVSSTERNALMRVTLASAPVASVPEPATEAAVAAGALLLLGAYRWASRRSV